MIFSLKFQRDHRQNALAVDLVKGKTGKKLYFHRTVKMKQPHTLTEPLEKAASRKTIDAFFLETQKGDNQYNAPAMVSANGNFFKPVFSTYYKALY